VIRHCCRRRRDKGKGARVQCPVQEAGRHRCGKDMASLPRGPGGGRGADEEKQRQQYSRLPLPLPR
jgi:hypothetical protein